MSDFVYLALTLVSFAGLALLVGAIDARLPSRDPDPASSIAAEPSKPDLDADAVRR